MQNLFHFLSRRRRFAISIGAAIFALVTACAPTAPAEDNITGTVTYFQRMALPPDAVVTVWLQDLASAKRLAEMKIPTTGRQVPIPFVLSFDPASIDPARSYVVQASISSAGRTMFGTNTPSSVLTRGAGASVVLTVEPVAAAAPGGATATLINTYWKLIDLGGTSPVGQEDNREANFILSAEGSSIAATGGCNRMFGNYESGPDLTLKLKVGGISMMACAEPLMKQEARFVEALNATTSYRIDGTKLELRKGDRVLARFESRDSK